MKNGSVHKKAGGGKEKPSLGRSCQGDGLQTSSITAPGNFTEIRVLWPHPRFTESEIWRQGGRFQSVF